MKYRVTVVQHSKYTETLVAEFDSFADADVFVKLCIRHCENVKVTVEPYEEESYEEVYGKENQANADSEED